MIIWISANLSSTLLTLLSTFSIEPIQWIIYFTFCIFSSKISNWKNCFYFSAKNFYLVFISCMFSLTSCNTAISAVLHSLTEKFWHLALFPDCCFSWKLVTFSRSFYVKQIWFGFWIFWIVFFCKLWVLLQSSGECCCCCCCCFSRWSTQLGSDHKFYPAFCGWWFQYQFSFQSFCSAALGSVTHMQQSGVSLRLRPMFKPVQFSTSLLCCFAFVSFMRS